MGAPCPDLLRRRAHDQIMIGTRTLHPQQAGAEDKHIPGKVDPRRLEEQLRQSIQLLLSNAAVIRQRPRIAIPPQGGTIHKGQSRKLQGIVPVVAQKLLIFRVFGKGVGQFPPQAVGHEILDFFQHGPGGKTGIPNQRKRFFEFAFFPTRRPGPAIAVRKEFRRDVQCAAIAIRFFDRSRLP